MQEHTHQDGNEAATHEKFSNIIENSVQSVCDLLETLPHKRLKYLELCITPGEGFNFVTNELEHIYQNTRDNSTLNLKNNLTTLHTFFLEDKELHITYAKDIESINGESLEQKQKEFTKFLKETTMSCIEEKIRNLIGSNPLEKSTSRSR